MCSGKRRRENDFSIFKTANSFFKKKELVEEFLSNPKPNLSDEQYRYLKQIETECILNYLYH